MFERLFTIIILCVSPNRCRLNTLWRKYNIYLCACATRQEQETESSLKTPVESFCLIFESLTFTDSY